MRGKTKNQVLKTKNPEHETSTLNPIVIKLGGALLAEPTTLDGFWPAVWALQETTPVVIVHGGGPQATAMARRLGHEPRIVHGRRVTTDLDLDIMQWTVRGAINVQLVGQAMRQGMRAVGLSGADGTLLRVTRRPPWQIDGETVDFGWVGDVDHANPEVLHALLGSGFLPIIAPLGIDDNGAIYNVNADTVARTLAEALDASQFLLVTASGGVRRDPEDASSLLDVCSRATFEAGKADGWIQGGMRVKLQVAFEALAAGIPDVFILAPDDVQTRSRATRVVT